MSYEQFYAQAVQAPRDKARKAATSSESASSEYDAAVKDLPKCVRCGKVLVVSLFGPVKLCCKA